MYQFSTSDLPRARWRHRVSRQPDAARTACCSACEANIERLATDRHYFARPARTLFNDIRLVLPDDGAAEGLARRHDVRRRRRGVAARAAAHGYDANGNPLQCRATTRRGTACQRMPLPHNGYCPSHQHLAETEEQEVRELAIAA